MTEYAYDRTGNAVLAMWSVGIGNVAQTAVTFGGNPPGPEYALQLGYELTQLSRYLWRTYTHPLTEAVDQPDEALSRARDQLAIDLVTRAMREPNLPVGNQMRICESQVLEAGHQLGRLLHRLGDGEVTDQAVLDVEAEIAALRRAALSDFTGRANQAVLLTRSDPQPQQVAAAHAYFEEDPIGPPELYTEIDATSAAVAAVHWFESAILLARRASAGDPSDEPPTCRPLPSGDLGDNLAMQAYRRLALGESPREAVVGMIQDGVAARTLLERLLIGIHDAWQLYGENNKTVPSHRIDDTFRDRTRRMAVEGRDRIL